MSTHRQGSTKRRWAALAMALGAGSSAAQVNTRAADGAQPYGVSPFVVLGVTATDNVNLSPTDRKSDVSVNATVGVRTFARGESLSGVANYSLTRVQYSRSPEHSQWLNSLDAAGTAEITRNVLFLDADASVAQQRVNALGVQAANPALAINNHTETARLSLGPRVQARLGDTADLTATLRQSITRNRGRVEGDNDATRASVGLQGVRSGRALWWGLEATHSRINYHEARAIQDDVVRGTLTVPVTSDLTATAIAGRESNNYDSIDKKSNTVWGAATEWTPSPRTRVAARYEHRFFGVGRSLEASYRTARTVWTFADLRDVSNSTTAQVRQVGTALDQMMLYLGSTIADPVQRAEAARALLTQNGIDPDAPAYARFVTPTVTLNSTQRLTVMWLGARLTLTGTLQRISTRRLDTVSPLFGDLALNDEVRETGASLQAAYRLTPASTMTATATERHALGVSTGETTRLHALTVGVTTLLGRRSSMSLAAGATRFVGTSYPYTEHNVSAMYRLEL